MKKILLLCTLFLAGHAFGQFMKCGDVLYKNYLFSKYPNLKELVPRPEDALASRSQTLYKIPVVVHIVYNSNAQNISDALINSQIATLNNDFRRLNADAANTRDIFKPIAGDAMIEFELAKVDPDGKPTTGITRTKTNKASFFELDLLLFFQASIACDVDFTDPTSIEENAECLQEFFEMNGVNFENIFESINNVKYTDKGGIDPWNQKKYLNIWVCNMAVDLLGQSTPFILGFAYPPVGAPLFPEGSLPDGYEKDDGVVIHYQVFGKNNPALDQLKDLNGEGRTTTHEVGHYLGLRHIWGDGDCAVDDGIADTPDASDSSQPQDGTTPTCETLHMKNTCTEASGPELPDMIENYMDYSRESCMNMFTLGQINMMRSMLEGPRAELVGLQASTVDMAGKSPVVFPNPTTDLLSFENINGNASVSLYNNSGILVAKFTYERGKQINVSALNTGLYFAKVQVKDRVSFCRFIKQ